MRILNMGYRINKNSVEIVEIYLKILSTTKNAEIKIESPQASRVSYLLAQGAEAAKQLEYEAYKDIRDNWKFSVSNKIITCSRKNPIMSLPFLEFLDIKDELDVLETIIDNPDIELRFPNFVSGFLTRSGDNFMNTYRPWKIELGNFIVGIKT